MARAATVVVLLVEIVGQCLGQQCRTSSDCTTPDAPYCSNWGWCQWTTDYGSNGPGNGGDIAVAGGSCRDSRDCTPRAPVCSNQGFCTEGIKKIDSVGTADASISPFKRSFNQGGGGRQSSTKQEARTGGGRVVGASSTRQEVRAIPEDTPSFIITDYDPDYYGAAEFEYFGSHFDILKKNVGGKDDSKLDSSIFGGNVELVTENSLEQPGDYYDSLTETATLQLDYSDSGGFTPSQGCLYDCVNDCVSIVELTAYKDCVNFCGKSCD